MATALGQNGMHAAALFAAVSRSFHIYFQLFKASTLICKVMGTGPVAMAPTGPVNAGSVIPAPGNFI